MSYIKIDRDLLYSYSFANPNHLKIWIWLLIKANYKDAFFSLNVGRGFKTIEVKRGQLIFGRNRAEEELGLNGSLIYRTLQTFEELGQINIETNSHCSVVTICKYDDYQMQSSDIEQPLDSICSTNEQHVNNTRTTREQHVNISKEELEEKEYKERESTNVDLKKSNLFRQLVVPSKDDVWEFFKSSGGTKEMAKSFYDKYEATGWMLNGSPVVNFRALAGRFIANWQQNDAKRNPPVQEQKQTLTKLPTYIQPKYD
ncbi:MAG: hypothetical protein RLZ10_620 [Bacteroidota bacterium]|jgi:hypothetical protein